MSQPRLRLLRPQNALFALPPSEPDWEMPVPASSHLFYFLFGNVQELGFAAEGHCLGPSFLAQPHRLPTPQPPGVPPPLATGGSGVRCGVTGVHSCLSLGHPCPGWMSATPGSLQATAKGGEDRQPCGVPCPPHHPSLAAGDPELP